MIQQQEDGDMEEAMAHDALIYNLSVVLMRLDGNDGDPHHLLWTGGTVPEPWGDAWQRYEDQANEVLNAIGEGSALAMVERLAAFPSSKSTKEAEDDWLVRVVSSGEYNFPLLEWRSANHSLETPIGTKLYARASSSIKENGDGVKVLDEAQERAAFEAAMRAKHPEWAFTPDPVFDYHNERTRCAWEGWQAARGVAIPETRQEK